MRIWKSALQVIGLLVFIVSLYSCGVPRESADNKSGGTGSETEATTSEDDGVYQGTVEKTEIDGDSSVNLRFGCIRNGIAYYICSTYDETEQEYKEFVRPMDVKTGYPAGEDFTINAGDEQINISSLEPCGDDAFVFTTMKYDMERGTSVFWLYKCSSDGTVVNKKNLSELPQIPEGSEFYHGIVSDGINIYLPTNGKLLVLGEGLGYKRTLSEGDVMSMCVGSDGLLYYLENYEGDISSYDPKTDKIARIIANIPSAVAVYADEGGKILVSTNSSLKSFDTATKETVKLFDFMDVNISATSFNGVWRDDEGDLHFYFCDYVTDTNSDVPGAVKLIPRAATVKRFDADSVPATEEIWLACFYANPDIRDAISEYNMAHPGLKVKLKVYSDEISDYQGQHDAYNKDLLDGVVYDIIKFDSSDLSMYTEKGLIEDLMPYIEKDSSFDLSKYYENILLAMKEDDKLYALVSGTMIIDLLGNAEVFGDKESITFDDVAKARAEHPDIPFFHYVQDSMGAFFFLLNIDYRPYLGGRDGVYDFTTPEFKKLCEFAATFPARSKEEFIPAYGYEALGEGREVLAREYYWAPEAWFTTRIQNGNKIKSYTGLTLEGKGYYLQPSTTYSISSMSRHKEEAWEIIKALLDTKSEFFASEYRASKEVTEYDLDMYFSRYNNGSTIVMGGTSYEMSMEKGDYDIVRGMLENATLGHSLDNQVYAIVYEEMPAYFAGKKTLDEVIKVMQSRVNLFIEENR
ncbi:MAG: hypothetical protein J5626_03955 [Lachnospiraceae bacterium]|nr:hypothetical protein [Lachnospiraceae bacterium]